MISGTIQAGPMKFCTEIAGDPEKYSCLIKRKMHKKDGQQQNISGLPVS